MVLCMVCLSTRISIDGTRCNHVSCDSILEQWRHETTQQTQIPKWNFERNFFFRSAKAEILFLVIFGHNLFFVFFAFEIHFNAHLVVFPSFSCCVVVELIVCCWLQMSIRINSFSFRCRRLTTVSKSILMLSDIFISLNCSHLFVATSKFNHRDRVMSSNNVRPLIRNINKNNRKVSVFPFSLIFLPLNCGRINCCWRIALLCPIRAFLPRRRSVSTWRRTRIQTKLRFCRRQLSQNDSVHQVTSRQFGHRCASSVCVAGHCLSGSTSCRCWGESVGDEVKIRPTKVRQWIV